MEFLRRKINRMLNPPRMSEEELDAQNPFGKLWPKYNISNVGWTVNEQFRMMTEDPELKAKFFFDKSDIPYLASSKFATKIGLNAEPKVPHRFIGFCYAKKEHYQELEKWLGTFPWAELTTDVNWQGLADKNSTRVQLRGAPIE